MSDTLTHIAAPATTKPARPDGQASPTVRNLIAEGFTATEQQPGRVVLSWGSLRVFNFGGHILHWTELIGPHSRSINPTPTTMREVRELQSRLANPPAAARSDKPLTEDEVQNVIEHGFIDDDATLDEEWLRQAFPNLERVTPHGPDYLAFKIGESRCEYCFGDDYNPPRLWVDSNTINDPRRWHVRQLAEVFGATLGTAAAT